MSVVIYSNISSLRAQRQLSKTSNALSTTFERLSSGQRINKASDDPAGLALASQLRVDSRLSAVAVRNANDGISAITVADGALAEISGILQRQAELAEQSANGVYSNQQRSALHVEFSMLASEITRIAKSTSFNKVGLLSNSNAIVFQVGLDSSSDSQISFEGVQGTLQALKLGSNDVLTYSIVAATEELSQQAARTSLEAVMEAIEEVSGERGSIGAAESRLTHAVDHLVNMRSNFEEAAGRITDADIAQEAANLTRLQILQQAAAAIAAQANLQPQIALQLLS